MPRSLTDFAVGRSDRRIFPEKIWRRLANECLGSVAAAMSDYADPCGSLHLRSLITENLRLSRGMDVTPEQVFIVSGCQQGIRLTAHLLIGVGGPVAVEAPCYRGAAYLFESYGAASFPIGGHGEKGGTHASLDDPSLPAPATRKSLREAAPASSGDRLADSRIGVRYEPRPSALASSSRMPELVAFETRSLRGLSPKRSLNRRDRWPALEKPVAKAISLTPRALC